MGGRARAGVIAAGVLVAAGVSLWLGRDAGSEFGGEPITPERCAEGADLRLVFQTSFDEEGGDILGLTVDGEVRQLTDDGLSYGPAISPDGTKVAFTRAAFTTDAMGAEDRAIYVMEVDGTDERQLVESDDDLSPTWSPDGERVAFVRARGYQEPSRIFVVDADGTGLRALVEHDGPEDDRDPAWSPDGEHLAFVRVAPEGGASQLMVAAADGSGARPVLSSDHEFGEPSWSPDSASLVFVEADEYRQLFPLAGGAVSVLVLGSGEVERVATPARDPVWSPTGRIYAYASAPAVADVSGTARVAELEPSAGGTFGTGRVVPSIEPTGFPYGDAAIDVPACDRDAPALTSPDDVPEALTVADPATGEDVQVLTREQALARFERDISPAPPPGTEAKLVRSDDPAVLELGVPPVGHEGLETAPEGPFVWLVGYDTGDGFFGVTVYDAASGGFILGGGGTLDRAGFDALEDHAP